MYVGCTVLYCIVLHCIIISLKIFKLKKKIISWRGEIKVRTKNIVLNEPSN